MVGLVNGKRQPCCSVKRQGKMNTQSKYDKDKAAARSVVNQFYTAICRRQQPSRKLIQQSYMQDVAAQGVRGLANQKIEALRNMGGRSFQVIHAQRKGENMIRFTVHIKSKIGTLKCMPNVIRENGTWGINPVSALPTKERVL